eukprot:8587299-Pyramimonas_sp.AAC.1
MGEKEEAETLSVQANPRLRPTAHDVSTRAAKKSQRTRSRVDKEAPRGSGRRRKTVRVPLLQDLRL